MAAKQVAQEVIDTVRKGKIPNVGAISVKHGYSVASAKANKAVKTQTYQAAIKPFVQKLEEERERAIDAMAGKIVGAKYRDLSDAIDKLTKNHQLLTGGATANVALGVKKLKDDELIAITEGGQD